MVDNAPHKTLVGFWEGALARKSQQETINKFEYLFKWLLILKFTLIWSQCNCLFSLFLSKEEVTGTNLKEFSLVTALSIVILNKEISIWVAEIDLQRTGSQIQQNDTGMYIL